MLGGLWYYFGMRIFPDRVNAFTTDRISVVPDRDFKCLPLYGDLAAQRRLYDRQRIGLEARRAGVLRLMNDGSAKLDPVLRFHLGLDEKKENESR